MKRLVILLIVVILSLATVSTVFAGKWVTPQTAPFYIVNGSSNSPTEELAGGEIHIVDPMGNVSLIIQGKVRGLEANTIYDVWVRDLTGYTGDYLYKAVGADYTYFKLLKITTDEFGNANFQIKLKAEDLPDGVYEIQVAINGDDSLWPTIIATDWPGVSVTVESK